jgi:hypothetical protein
MKYLRTVSDYVMGYIVAGLVWLIGFGYGDSEAND